LTNDHYTWNIDYRSDWTLPRLIDRRLTCMPVAAIGLSQGL